MRCPDLPSRLSTVAELPHVKRVEFYAPQNAREHHTLKYELVRDRYRADPVLRRGQPFYLAVQMDRQIDPAREKLYVVFTYGQSRWGARWGSRAGDHARGSRR